MQKMSDIDAAVIVLSEELRQIIKEKRTKREKCRNWIARRQTHGASNTLLRAPLFVDFSNFSNSCRYIFFYNLNLLS
jgi:hypothetical protein